MKLFKRLLMVFAFSLPFFLVSNTEAGKGVKKNNLGLNTRSVSGTIIGTNPVNKTFAVRSMQSQKKMVAVNGGNLPAVTRHGVTTEFQLTPSTMVVNQTGTPTSIANMRNGLRTRVLASGTQASSVQLYLPTHSYGYVNRHRPHSYRPHVYHQRPHNLHHNHHRRR